MVDLYKKYGTDVEKETKGVWVEFGGAKFLLSRMGGRNTAYSELARTRAEYVNEAQLSSEEEEAEVLKLFCSSILLDWSNVHDEEGTLIAYSSSAAEKLLKDLPDLYLELVRKAMSMDTFRLDKYLKN